MKGRLQWTWIGVAAAVGLTAAALGAGEQIKIIDIDAWGPGCSGGPFEVQPISFGFTPGGTGQHGAAANNFLTFCVETNEYLSEGKTYDVVFNTDAVNGGSGGGNPDPLDAMTACLYTAFIKGTLDDKLLTNGHTFTYGSEPDGKDLQQAIWVIENEGGLTYASLSTLGKGIYDLAKADVATGGEWYNKRGANSIGHVRVMNLSQDGNDNQDLLVLIPLPAPACLGLVGLIGVGILRRRLFH